MLETNNQLNEDQGEDEYTNVAVLSDLDTPTLDVCQQLRALKPTNDPNVKVR